MAEGEGEECDEAFPTEAGREKAEAANAKERQGEARLQQFVGE